MKRLAILAFVLAGCAQMPFGLDKLGGWETLIDGEKGLDNFNRVGDANWRAEGGAIVADKAATGGHLVTKNSYKDFQLRVEFWADHHTNSGIFIRIQDPKKIGANNSYEVNIYDQRPGPEYGTGGIVDFAKVQPIYKAGGKWNTYEITAQGKKLTVMLNGVKTAEIDNVESASGPIALQYGTLPPEGKPGGAIKWRKVQVREL